MNESLFWVEVLQGIRSIGWFVFFVGILSLIAPKSFHKKPLAYIAIGVMWVIISYVILLVV